MSETLEIGSTKPRIRYEGDGSTKEFNFSFAIFEESNIDVYADEILLSDGYTVQKEEQGGKVIFNTAPASGIIITIYRNLELKRTTNFQEVGPFRTSKVNLEFDYQLACMEQLQDSVSRSITFPPYAPTQLNVDLPLPVPGKAIIWNAAGDRLQNSSIEIEELTHYYSDILQRLEEIKALKDQTTEIRNQAQGYASEALSHVYEAQNEVTNAQAEVSKAQAEVINAQNEVNKAKTEVENAKAEVTKAQNCVGQAQGYANQAANSLSQIQNRPETIYTVQKDLGNINGSCTIAVTPGIFEYRVTPGGNINFNFDFSNCDTSMIISFSLMLNQTAGSYTYSYTFPQPSTFQWLDNLSATPSGSYLMTFRRYPDGRILGVANGVIAS